MHWVVLAAVLAPCLHANLFYLESDERCVRDQCPQADYFHYYNCNETRCDFHLQPWLFAVVAFIVISFLLSLVCTLLNCICCSDRR
ncbi:unnamed protein product [Bursaphelenchus okinawaensis]|uniref:Uncharacterized protein n=1 Tax=Bursaphelenchus okinawaensis TaxID=465554 RepID=A0A811JU33_9BILA|nr:unnamed protein product [Bursaphelenchus okinawaensis]CAG9083112.1 unnamed protein product [Bursaphelenchus okinawaensis]